MNPSAGVFVFLCVMSVLCWRLGDRLGREPDRRAQVWLGVALLLLLVWGWLAHNPSIAVEALPVALLYYLEGTAAVPVFMFIVGHAWARSRLPRQRRASALAGLLGIVYFLHGGLWLIQSTPETFADHVDDGIVRQSSGFSCVPAACATALRHLGVHATETELARLTEARPGSGSTLIRATRALELKLAGTGIHAEVLEPSVRQLSAVAPPVLTPIRGEVGREHMVVITRVADQGAWLADPMQGHVFVPHEQWDEMYTRRVIAFVR